MEPAEVSGAPACSALPVCLSAAHHSALPPGMCSVVSYELTRPVFLSTDGKLSINFYVFGIFSLAVVDSCKLMLIIPLSHA